MHGYSIYNPVARNPLDPDFVPFTALQQAHLSASRSTAKTPRARAGRVGQPGAAAGAGAMKTSPELDVKTDR
jgi:hypothetical protein